MQDNESIPEKTSSVTAVNSSNWRSVVAIVITALIAGTSGYLLGTRTNQNASQTTQIVPLLPSPTVRAQSTVSSPSPVPSTTNWKTYVNDEFRISFNYPDDWVVMSPHRYDSRVGTGRIAAFPMGRGNGSRNIYGYLFADKEGVEDYFKYTFKGSQERLSFSKRESNHSPYYITEYIITDYYRPYAKLITPPITPTSNTKAHFIGIEKSGKVEQFLFVNISTFDQIFYDIAFSFRFTP